MKICIWTSSIFKLGGTKRVITIIANEMVKKHDVTIMTFDRPEIEDRKMYGLDKRIAVDYVDSSQYKDARFTPARFARSLLRVLNNKLGILNRSSFNSILKGALYPKYIRKKWSKYINSKDYDLVIATAGLSLILAFIAEHLKAKTVGWEHNCYDAYFNERDVLFWKKNELIKVYFAKLDAVLVLNDYDKIDYKEKLGIDCKVMGNPRSFESKQKSDLTKKQFIVAARFVEAKGIDLVLSSYAKFLEANQEWDLLIAGDGPDRPEILEKLWKLGLQERVKFVGVTDNIIKYYLESSVYLLSSRWEGWGLVIIEAFELGLPVIAYDIVPIDLLITNGIDGFIVEKFDTVKFAAAMVKLANDEELRRAMSKKAIETAEKYSIEKNYELWESLLVEMQK